MRSSTWCSAGHATFTLDGQAVDAPHGTLVLVPPGVHRAAVAQVDETSVLVLVDSARRPETGAEQWQERRLNDGSPHRVYKRSFTGAELAAELGGADVLLDGDWFVAVRAPALSPGRAPGRP